MDPHPTSPQLSDPPIRRTAMLHTRYARPGGEDLSTASEVDALRRGGVEVAELTLDNGEVLAQGHGAALKALWRSPFNREVYRQVRRFCRRERPEVAHVQNFWWAMSPAVHAACHDEGVATVQSLRNYRLLCVNALLQRKGRPCEDCVGHLPWRGVLHRCYHGSALHSLLVARMIAANRRRRTWHRDVDMLVALTEFARGRLVAGGLPAERLVVKPNAVADPGPETPPGEGAVFLGRLSAEKGLHTLLAAWRQLPEVPLVVLGDGPLAAELKTISAGMPQVCWLGHRPPSEGFATLRRSGFLVMASEWYEGFPRVIVEAFALGRAVIAPRLGSMAEIVADGRTGLHFRPGDAADLAAQVRRLAADPELCGQLGAAARREYEARYTPEHNREQLLAIYRQARRRFQAEHPERRG